MSKHPSKKPSRVRKRLDPFIRGVLAHFGNGETMRVDGKLYDQAGLLGWLQPLQTAHQEVEQVRNLLSAKVHVREQLSAAAKSFLDHLPLALGVKFGATSPILYDFGLRPARPRKQPTVEQKTIAYAEGVRTRRARGSYTSDKQRKEITVEGKRGLSLVTPDGEVKEILPPAPPGKPRPRRK